MVFTIKYRAFLQIFPSSNSMIMTSYSARWFFWSNGSVTAEIHNIWPGDDPWQKPQVYPAAAVLSMFLPGHYYIIL